MSLTNHGSRLTDSQNLRAEMDIEEEIIGGMTDGIN